MRFLDHRGLGLLLAAATAALALSGPPVLAGNEARVALVIGNDAYEDAPLRNAVNDAEDLAKMLEELSFSVQKVTDADLPTMERAINEFIRKIPEDGIAFFHFSGHGMQIEGQNFLIPVGFKAEDEVDAKYAAYSAERILARMERTPSRLNVIVLDACRDNPCAAAGASSPESWTKSSPTSSITRSISSRCASTNTPMRHVSRGTCAAISAACSAVTARGLGG